MGRASLAGGAVALLPGAVLAVLVGLRLLPVGAALVAEAVIVLGFAALAALWLADLQRLLQVFQPNAVEGARFWPFRAASVDVRRRLAERDAMEAEARLASGAERAIVELMPDPVLILSGDRTVLRSNRAARDVLGTEIPALLRHPTLRGAIDRVQAPTAAADEDVHSVELLIPAPVVRDLQATVINLGVAGRPDSRTALVLADRTRARAVERMRADFVANASHELRTPLASLIGFIDTLRGPAVDDVPAQQRFLGIMAEQAARMNRLIDDLLSLSRIELTEHVAPSDRVDLAMLVNRALLGFEPRRVAEDAKVEQEITPGLPLVLADADQLEQVLQNLLDNALKYGRRGGTIRLGLNAASGGRWPVRPGVVLSVRDEGQGIARVHLPRLTERFYRVDRGRSRAAGGTGLGLAIVKHIVTRHRGQLVVESEEGVGSSFSVWLPCTGNA